jgi:carbon storage regulator
MLVLTRRQGESIIIGEGIKLTVVSVGPGRVKIGITAPPDVRINREEIHSRIQQEQIQQENSADVLEAVSSSKVVENHSGQNTISSSAADTAILNSPVSKNQHDNPHIVTTANATAPSPQGSKFNPHRKPR